MGDAPHPALSVSEICFRPRPLDEGLAQLNSLGVQQVGLVFEDDRSTDDVVSAIVATDLSVTNVLVTNPIPLDRPDSWARHDRRIRDAVVLSDRVDAPSVVLTSGSAGRYDWDTAADSFVTSLTGVRETSDHLGARLLLEPTTNLRADLSFAFSYADAAALADHADLGLCLEATTCWCERDLDATLSSSRDRLSLVHVSDRHLRIASTPDRLAPGDGALPLQQLLTKIVSSGYEGFFELELAGPAIDDLGPERAVRRGVERLSQLLHDVGAATPTT
jgi:sugar phosphate isomerase/epimerase